MTTTTLIDGVGHAEHSPEEIRSAPDGEGRLVGDMAFADARGRA